MFSQSVFSQSVFSQSVFFQSVFSQSVFPQSVFFQSVFIQSVFLRDAPDLRVFYALRVYLGTLCVTFSDYGRVPCVILV